MIKNGPHDVTVPRKTLFFWRVDIQLTVVVMIKSVFFITTVVAFFFYKLLAVMSSYKALLGRFSNCDVGMKNDI